VPEEYRDHRSRPLITVPPGQYYVLGDHRSSSNDSRNWGPVARDRIYGKAVFVYWPLEKAEVAAAYLRENSHRIRLPSTLSKMQVVSGK